MAKVFSGKVMIPGHQMEAYFQAMAEAEKERAPFRNHLEDLCEDFSHFLSEKYTRSTVRKHTSIVSLFIDFICNYTDVQKIEEITKGMVNSHFRSWYKRKVWDSATDNDLKVALRKFFQFLAQEKAIVNQKALDSLK
ncbi:MAG: site-specific integrase [Microcystaceae cyanobacterium]